MSFGHEQREEPAAYGAEEIDADSDSDSDPESGGGIEQRPDRPLEPTQLAA